MMSKKIFISALVMCITLSSVSMSFGYTDFDVDLSTKEIIDMEQKYGSECDGIANVTASKLNVRSKPNAEQSKVMGQLSKGEEVYVHKKFQDSNGDVWYLVSDKLVYEFNGWVSGKHIQFDENPSSSQYASNSYPDISAREEVYQCRLCGKMITLRNGESIKNYNEKCPNNVRYNPDAVITILELGHIWNRLQ